MRAPFNGFFAGIFFSGGHQTGHFLFGNFDFLSAKGG
jgi:hypothetical protein